MKKSLVVLTGLFFLLLWTGATKASPIYITLEGSIDRLYDLDGKIEAMGFFEGMQAKWVVVIDKDLPGYSMNPDQYNGKRYLTDDNNHDYYYAELLYGPTLPRDENSRSVENCFYGSDDRDMQGEISSQYLQANAHEVSMPSGWISFNRSNSWHYAWKREDFIIRIGDTFGVYATTMDTHNSNFTGSFIKVTALSDTNPIPEPATMLLFGVGLLGIAGISRRRKKSAPDIA